jgi:hypothetical protein
MGTPEENKPIDEARRDIISTLRKLIEQPVTAIYRRIGKKVTDAVNRCLN